MVFVPPVSTHRDFSEVCWQRDSRWERGRPGAEPPTGPSYTVPAGGFTMAQCVPANSTSSALKGYSKIFFSFSLRSQCVCDKTSSYLLYLKKKKKVFHPNFSGPV